MTTLCRVANNRRLTGNSIESSEAKPKRTFTAEGGKPNKVQKLFKLEELNAEVISVPQGNLHNKAYTYRMLTYSVPLPNATFKVRNEDVTVFMENMPFKPRGESERKFPRLLRSIIEWGKKPFVS